MTERDVLMWEEIEQQQRDAIPRPELKEVWAIMLRLHFEVERLRNEVAQLKEARHESELLHDDC